MNYEKPKTKLFRSFAYLDDELVLNSLSAFEAGQIDEVVSKIRDAKESGFGGSISAHAFAAGQVSADAKKGKQVSFEDELIRRRTRFSIFESWMSCLERAHALGTLSTGSDWQKSWPQIGDLLRVTGTVHMYEIYSLVRMYHDFAKSSKIPGHPWYAKGEEAKQISQTASNLNHIFGEVGHMRLPAHIKASEGNSSISFVLAEENLVGRPGPIEGTFEVVGQVKELLNADDWFPTLRMMPLAPKSEFERNTVREMLRNFESAAQNFGVEAVEGMGEFQGPAIVLEPIAIYR